MTKTATAAPERMVAIDPGEVHCGVAIFLGDKCTDAFERKPGECIRDVWVWIETGAIDTLVIEEFRLYPDKAPSLYGSELWTVQVIGVLRFLHAAFQMEGSGVKLVMQGASIKKPTRAILRAKRIASVAKALKVGGHALDAELHGYHYVLHGRDKEAQ